MSSVRTGTGIVFASSAALALTACALVAGIEDFQSGAGPLASQDGQAPASDRDGQVASPVGTGEGGTPVVDCVTPCSGGVCFQGKCYPEVIAAGLSQPHSIAAVGTIVAWLERPQGQGTASTLRSCPKTGCLGATPTTIASSESTLSLRQASEDSGNVTFTDPARAADTASPTAGPLFAVSGSASLEGGLVGGLFAEPHWGTVVQGASSSSWYAFVSSTGVYYGQKGATPILGASAGGGLAGVGEVVAVRNDVIVLGFGTHAAGIGVCLLAAADCGDSVVIPEPGSVVDLAVSGTTVAGASIYYVTHNGTTLGSANPPTTLGPSMADVGASNGLAVDAKNVYVASKTKGLVAVDRASKAQQSLFGAQPTSVASDGTFIYWTEAAGRILRGPRP